jgi:hypothetical protein
MQTRSDTIQYGLEYGLDAAGLGEEFTDLKKEAQAVS